MTGQTNTGAILVNGFFDLYTPSDDNVTNIAPYIGLGIGYSYVQNNLTFQYNQTYLANGEFVQSYYALAGQAIVGVNYFMDDFTTIGLDFRAFSTTNQQHSNKYLPISVDTQAQIYSINLVFNGAFELG